ncbi:MAG: hypothetical protein JSR47_10030, partial [Proteobacteria bacterium]|nr:hypothetical protein [Pseudomonadota bacterium]
MANRILRSMIAAATLASATAAQAEDKPTWTGPFGGTFNASFAFTTDY